MLQALCVHADSVVHRVHQVFSVSRTRIRPVERHAYYTGVTTNKNMLGYLLLVFGLLFLCNVFTRVVATGSEKSRSKNRRRDRPAVPRDGCLADPARQQPDRGDRAVGVERCRHGAWILRREEVLRRRGAVVDRDPSHAAIYVRYLDHCPRERWSQRDAHGSHRNLGDGTQVGSEPSGRRWLPELLARRSAREDVGNVSCVPAEPGPQRLS